MKTVNIFGEGYRFIDRKLPFKYAVIGLPHQLPAFAYLNDTYRDDLDRLEDCHGYHAFSSLKQAIEFLEKPHGHQRYEAAARLLEQLISWNILELIEIEIDE